MEKQDIIAKLGIILGADVKPKIEELVKHLIVHVHVKGTLVHSKIAALMEMGAIEMKRSSDGIKVSIVIKREEFKDA